MKAIASFKSYLVPFILFVATFLSLTFKELLFVGWFPFNYDAFRDTFLSEYPYSVSLILILLCHELGHYLPARYYGIRASLPHFIPFPFGPVGTMGAVIQIKEKIPDKSKLFDIGVGGPLASLVLSVIAWVVGLSLSELVSIPQGIESSHFLFFGDSLFTKLSSQLIFGSYDSSVYDVQIHPLARAGWVGLLITAINLLPFGQLDGGHIIYSVFGESYRKWINWLFVAFCFLGFWNISWLLWGFIIYFLLKVEHPHISDGYPLIGKGRKALGIGMLVSLILIFVPQPLILGSDLNRDSLFEYTLHLIFGSIFR